MTKYVYRVLKKRLTINTVLFTDGQKNTMYAELGFKKGVSLTFEGFSSVEINKIKFVNLDKVDYLFQINFLNMLPMSTVNISRISFGDEATTKSFFQFNIDTQVTDLIVTDFKIVHKTATLGWQLFKFVDSTTPKVQIKNQNMLEHMQRISLELDLTRFMFSSKELFVLTDYRFVEFKLSLVCRSCIF